MRRFRSIRVRLLTLIGLLLLVVLAGFGYVAWRRGWASRIATIDRELEERLNPFIAGFRPALRQRPGEIKEPQLTTRARGLFANEGGEPFYYRMWLSDGADQAHSDHAPEMPMPQRLRDAKAFCTRGEFRELFQFTPTGRCFLVGRSIRTDLAALQSDAVHLAAIGTGILMFGLLLAWWIALRVTRPLIEISRTAQHIAAGDLSQRIQLYASDDEISDVAGILNQTFARLEDAFARQKQFTADASHELRTPVSLMLAHAQGALLHEQTPEDYRETLTDCVQAAQRMKSLIESLLDLARFDSKAELVQQEACDLADLTRDCAALLGPLAQAKRLRLDFDLQPACCRGDAARLKQVITNLFANAIHFTPEEGTIALRTFQNGHAGFTIKDSGPGIAPAQRPYIFERFHRADASRARATGGTGLGLAICKAVVKAHGGSITVESELEAGTTFMVLLPPTPH